MHISSFIFIFYLYFVIIKSIEKVILRSFFLYANSKHVKERISMSSINKNEQRNKKKMFALSEIEKRKVVEHNDLISSVAKMDKTPLKIFELAVSCIDTENPPKDNIVYLSKSELFSFFDVSDNDKHSRFKHAIGKMQEQAFFNVRQVTDKGVDFERIVPIPYIKWNDYNDEVVIRFDMAIMPYLIELKQNFTQYALSDVMELNSKYSIILYKWLSMNYNQFEHYNVSGGRREEQIERYRNPSISVQELRTITDTTTEYKLFTNFSKFVLDKPIQEINEHTHFNISYEKIKKGRSIDSIQFFISKKKIAKNENYKHDQQDVVYLKGKKKKEEEQQRLFTQAMQSEYTKLLSENNLLFPQDFMDLNTMSELQRLVYPLYDELKEQRGMIQVKKHISYVSDKQESYSKRNISRYLYSSIKQYIDTEL